MSPGPRIMLCEGSVPVPFSGDQTNRGPVNETVGVALGPLAMGPGS